MPEYLAPGVYVEETGFRAKSMAGVGTGTAAFVGPARIHARTGLLRALRPQHHDSKRYRQRPPDLPGRCRAHQTGGVHPIPHRAEDRRRARLIRAI